MDRQIRDRPPDPRRRSATLGAQGPIRHVHRRLGDAVHVDELAIAVARILVPGTQHSDFQRLPAEHHVTQLVLAIALGLCRDQLTERARRLVQHRHAGIAKQRITRLRRATRQFRHDHQPAAVQQRAPDFPDREVEGERVEQRPGVLRSEAVPRLRGREQPRHVAVLDHHALRLPRRTRGVDHISEAARIQPFHHRIVARRIAFAWRIDIDHRHRQPAQHLARAGLHQHRQRRAVAQRVSKPLGRVSRVQRHVTGAGLQHAQQPGDHARAALHADRHAIVRLHAQPDQAMRDAIGPRVQLAVAQAPPLEFQRDRIRRLCGTGLEQAMQRLVPLERRRARTPRPQTRELPGRRQAQVGNRHARILEHLPEQLLETRADRLDFLLLEVGAVVHEVNPRVRIEAVLADMQGQWQLLVPVRAHMHLRRALAETHVVIVPLVRHRYVEQLRAARLQQPERAVQLADREALMTVILLERLAERLQQFVEALRRIVAQAHRADAGEHAGRLPHPRIRAIQDRQADRQLVALGGAREIHMKQAEDHMERRRLAAPREGGDAIVERARQAQRMVPARRDRPVEALARTRREQRIGHRTVLVEPVGALPLELRRFAERAILLDELEIGRRIELRFPALRQRAVDPCQRIDQQADRPAVDDQVMEIQCEQEVRRVDPRQLEAEQGPAVERKRFGQPLPGPGDRRGIRIRLGREIVQGHLDREGLRDRLARQPLAVLARHQHQAQRVMTRHQQVHGAFEARRVDATGDSRVPADLVDRCIAVHGLVEPDFSLRGRQRMHFAQQDCLVHCAFSFMRPAS